MMSKDTFFHHFLLLAHGTDLLESVPARSDPLIYVLVNKTDQLLFCLYFCL